MKIIPLSEGSFTVDQTKEFQPFEADTDELSERTRGSLLVEIQPFIVVTSKDIILLDTGLGFKKNDRLQLIQNVMDAGINPSEITKVLMSHLHKDHAGGVSELNELTRSRYISFPQANYYVQKKEIESGLQNESSYRTDELLPLKDFPGVVWLDGDGIIDDYIKYEITGAHSPFHQVFWISDEGETVFYGGDEAPQLNQMKSRYMAKYDHDGKKAMELRHKWWDEGTKEGWKFLFYHDIKTPVV